MGHWDEACFLCGITQTGPSDFATDIGYAITTLVDALLEHFPDILSTISNVETEDDLQSLLTTILEKTPPYHLEISSMAFRDCIAIGYFSDTGATPRKTVDDPTVKLRLPDGQFVTTRCVDDPAYGEFGQEIVEIHDPNTGEVKKFWEERISRTGGLLQGGFGNFFLSKCCLGFLERWIDRTRLPPMWDGRCLSFVGELWEIINSRETGRSECSLPSYCTSCFI